MIIPMHEVFHDFSYIYLPFYKNVYSHYDDLNGCMHMYHFDHVR
jgi:hypothetical protein